MKKRITILFLMAVLVLVCTSSSAHELRAAQKINLSGTADSPQLATNESGQTILVWREKDGSGVAAKYRLYARWYDLGSDTWSGLQQITDTGFIVNSAESLQVKLNSSGTATIVWEQGSKIYLRTYSASGTLGALTQLSTSGREATSPNLAASGNTLGVIWVQENETGQKTIQSAFSDNWTIIKEVVGDEDDIDVEHPQMAIDGSGNAIAVWQAEYVGAYFSGMYSYGVYAKRYSGVGDNWVAASTTTLLDLWEIYTIKNEPLPQVVMNHDGQAVVAWGESETSRTYGSDVLFSRYGYDDCLTNWTSKQTVVSYADSYDWKIEQFKLSIDEDGYIFFAAGAHDRTTEYPGLRDVEYYNPETNTDAYVYTEAFSCSGASSFTSSGLDVASQGSLRVIVNSVVDAADSPICAQGKIFLDGYEGDEREFYVASIDHQKSLSNALSYTPTNISSIDVAIVSDEDVVVAWQDATTDHAGVYVTAYARACGDGDIDSGEECDDGSGNNDASDCNTSCQTQVYIYRDADHDGYGTGDAVWRVASMGYSGYSELNGDCDDLINSVYPDATESCNGVDDNCNGTADEGLVSCDTSPTTDGDDDSGDDDDASVDEDAGADNDCTGGDAACSVVSSVCGNGIVEGSEQCDDGNTANNDGCTGICQTEATSGGNAVAVDPTQPNTGESGHGDEMSNDEENSSGGGGGCSLRV